MILLYNNPIDSNDVLSDKRNKYWSELNRVSLPIFIIVVLLVGCSVLGYLSLGPRFGFSL